MKSVLSNIKEAVEQLNWKNETFKDKALNLCISIFNLYVYDGGDFYKWKELTKEYFKEIICTNSYIYPIVNNLIDSGILEKKKFSRENKGKSKKGLTTIPYCVYRFKNELIEGNFTLVLNGPKNKSANDSLVLNGPKNDLVDEIFGEFKEVKINNNNLSIFKSILNNQLYHISGPKLESLENTKFNDMLDKLEIDEKVNEYINNYKLDRDNIMINEDIDLEYVDIRYENGEYRYKIEKALEQGRLNNKDLILYKDKCYIENLDDFIIRKESDLKIIFRKSIFDIQNKIFRASRNETNRRLDYNLTNMKSDLIDFLRLDGEKLVEIDIKNAQFTLLTYLFQENLDEDFINLTKEGKLYEYMAEKLNISRKQAKNKMFRVAFDKVKKEQNDIREIFPKTMEFVDKFKKENGYSKLSILLQNVESIIMIDGLLNEIEKKGFEVFPIHDAIRVKENQVDEVYSIIKDYFLNIDFECFLNKKSKIDKKEEKKKITIKYKGFKEVEIDEPTKEDKKLFLDIINRLKKEYFGESEDILTELNIFDKYKTWYMYDKYIKTFKKEEILENPDK